MTSEKLDLIHLQNKYPQYILAINPEQTIVLAKAKSFSALINKLKKQRINPQDCLFIGPIPQKGTIKV